MRGSLLALLAAALLLPAFSCPIAAPAKDFPELPLPDETQIVKVRAVKTDDGVLLEQGEFLKVLRMLKELQAERDALRNMIRTYNDWAESRRGE